MRRAITLMQLVGVASISAVALFTPSTPTAAKPPTARAGVTCDDYDNQAHAQRAADTSDADGDGIYCVIYSE